MKWIVAAVLVALAGCSEEARQAPQVNAKVDKQVAPNAEPFDFHGIKLGITRAEFKAIASPPVAKDSDMKSGPIATCSRDPNGRMKGGMYLKQTDAESNCWWEYDTGAKKGKPVWERYVVANVMVGDDEDKNYRFDFAAMPGDSDHKLYHMLVSFPSKGWESVVLALTEKFGPPVVGREQYTLDSGSEISTDAYSWKRPGSSVRAVKNVSLHNVGYVSYTLDKYAIYVYQQNHTNDPPNAGKM